MTNFLGDLDARSRDVFRSLVSEYLETGRPVGSRLLAERPEFAVSSATIRNIMQQLQEAGLLASPHTSAGRIPTADGLRFYVDGLMERGNLSDDERAHIDAECRARAQAPQALYDRAGHLLCGLSSMLGMVIAGTHEALLKSVHFVRIAPSQAIVILVGTGDNQVENRLLNIAPDLPDSLLEQASNFLNARLKTKPLSVSALNADIARQLASEKDVLESKLEALISQGLAHPASRNTGALIVHGQSQLLRAPGVEQDIMQVQQLLASFDEHEQYLKLMDAIGGGEGVKIFIGSDTSAFSHIGWSAVLAPYRGADNGVVGAVGVIGPSYLNYKRIVPLVDYTADVVSRLLSEGGTVQSITAQALSGKA
jgi:heat-inducible transcriptional repressor